MKLNYRLINIHTCLVLCDQIPVCWEIETFPDNQEAMFFVSVTQIKWLERDSWDKGPEEVNTGPEEVVLGPEVMDTGPDAKGHRTGEERL